MQDLKPLGWEKLNLAQLQCLYKSLMHIDSSQEYYNLNIGPLVDRIFILTAEENGNAY